jgi:PhoH-like ATPase
MSDKKNYVLDTNVLLHDNQSIFRFEENNVIIPMIVLEELDNHNEGLSDKAFHARKVARYLDKLSKRGKLCEGIELDNGGTLQVVQTDRTGFDESFDEKNNDNTIIYHAKANKYNPELETILVSMDVNVRLKARTLNIPVEGYEPTEIRQMDSDYRGHSEMFVTSEEIDEFFKTGGLRFDTDLALYDNQFVNLLVEGSTQSALGKYVKKYNTLLAINNFDKDDIKVKAKNREQRYLLDALMDPDIQLVTVTGKAGTGKTLLAAAAALQQVTDGSKKKAATYKNLVIARPIMPLGKDIGYLPGSKEDKILPYLQPIFDNLRFMMDESKPDKGGIYSIEDLMEEGLVQLEALTYIRGRTFHNQILIIDEAQNLTKHEIKTILTRAGEGTKIVLTGDVEQIDSPFLDQNNNGLSLVLDKFKDESIAAHIHLSQGERSVLAEKSATIL